MAISDTDFQWAVRHAWEGIASDAGSVDGEGALDHIEAIFFALLDSPELDEETRERVNSFDPHLKMLAREALKSYG